MDFAEEGEELICEGGSGSAEDIEFDLIVGALEELILGDDFAQEQNSFCDAHCDVFEDGEENKIEYTDLFQQYTSLIENLIEAKLSSTFPDFSMSRFESLLSSRQDELSGELFDLLLSLGDFAEFKQLMLSQKKAKRNLGDLDGLAITGQGINLDSEFPSPTR